MVRYEYQSPDSPALIAAYYQQNGCEDYPGSSQPLCEGEGYPFGEYSLWLEYQSTESIDTSTTFSIEVAWDKCPPGIKEDFIEDFD